jgi:hypothetical protein
MIRKKCLGCTNAYGNGKISPMNIEMRLDVFHCTYTLYGTVPNCPCADCMLKPICTASCLDFINKLLKYKDRVKAFDVSLEHLKCHLLEIQR